MQTVEQSSNFIEGTFLKELKNRFLCEVLVNGEPTVCYVPSSCHLGNFLDLKNKKVLLVRTQTPKSRTQYALFAVPFKRSQIILNTSMANSAVANSINGRRFSYLGPRKTVFKEHRIDDYKADLYIKDTNTIIEIKSIIATNKAGIFPTVYSERTLNQLKKIQYLLSHGYRVCFIIVSLNPYVSEIQIDDQTEFFGQFKACIDQGMIVKGYACGLVENCLKINKAVEIRM
jgi:DNA-binding sugar fermentation-stimulating protein